MKIITTEFPGVLIIEPRVFSDERGYFFESFNLATIEKESGIKMEFVQHNQSKSVRGALRGLHFQREPYAQSKLVRVLSGSVLDVIVDIREGSPTFAKHLSIELTGENKRQLFVPKGFAHGFVTLSEAAEFFYCVDSPYSPAFDDGIRFDDPRLGIDWSLPDDKLTLSLRDKNLGSFESSKGKFKY
jgi:dTDP-4-dehydrorhamnose 3,5-epimerase